MERFKSMSIKLDFSQIIYQIVPYVRFFFNFYFENLCFQLPNKNGDLSFLLYLPKEILIGNIKEKIEKKCRIIFIFLGITLIGQNGKILTAVIIDLSQSDYFGRLLLIFSRHSLIIILFTKQLCVIKNK